MVGPLVELGIEADHASVGVLQFLVELSECLLPFLQLLELCQQSWFWRRISSTGSAGSSAASAWPIRVSIARLTAGA